MPESRAGTDRTGTAEISDLITRALPTARPETHRLLAGTARVRTVVPDDTIFRQGEKVPLTLIVRGYGAYRRTTVDGRQLIVGVASRGDMVGFSSIASADTAADLVALTEGEVALWSGRDLRQLAAGDSGLALGIIDQMAEFLGISTERLDGFLYQDARRRVLRVLGQYKDLFFGEPAVLSRAHLPSMVGTTREMTSRVLRELEREGLVMRVGRRGLHLRSPARLRHALAPLAVESG
jgi:CRP-like cAMP-binding protein